jgi:hypothetical protein
MARKETYPELTPEQVAAVQAFADAHGKKWKETLAMVYWYNARPWRGPLGNDEMTGCILHTLRNTHGPRWLDSYRLPAKV